MMELTVVLPAFNEASALPFAVESYCQTLAKFCPSFEIVVVNDGSTDHTAVVLGELVARHANVRRVDNERNLGQVASILRGFAAARGSIVMHNGVDLPFDPSDTKRVLQLMRAGNDVVVVERNDRSAYGGFRRLVSWCNLFLTRSLLDSPYKDHNFVQAFRGSVLESITVESTGVSTVTTELILKARCLGFQVAAMKAHYLPRRSGKSTVTFGRIIHTTRELFRLAEVMRRFRRQVAVNSFPKAIGDGSIRKAG